MTLQIFLLHVHCFSVTSEPVVHCKVFHTYFHLYSYIFLHTYFHQIGSGFTAPLITLHGTPGCRGTHFGNHWSRDQIGVHLIISSLYLFTIFLSVSLRSLITPKIRRNGRSSSFVFCLWFLLLFVSVSTIVSFLVPLLPFTTFYILECTKRIFIFAKFDSVELASH